MPAAHGVQALDEVCPIKVLKVPAAHFVHSLDPAKAPKYPDVQGVHAADEFCPDMALNVPTLHNCNVRIFKAIIEYNLISQSKKMRKMIKLQQKKRKSKKKTELEK